MEQMYANKFTVTIAKSEAVLRFGWIVPTYNENDQVSGNQIVEERSIVLSRGGFESFRNLINSLEEEDNEDT